MTHPTNHRKTLGTSLIGAAVLAMGLLAPVVASADSNDRVRVSNKAVATPVNYGYSRDHRYNNRHDRYSRNTRFERNNRSFKGGRYDSRYFVKPNVPLNFKHWWRVERQLNAYAPSLRGLNRYEVRQVLGHSYDRYLRDHRNWSHRAQRRAVRGLRRW